MAHFAKVVNGLVTQVIVAEQDFIDTLEDKDTWVQTSYNTFGGQHKLGGTPLRKNYAGIGYSYDSVRDAFISKKPFESWLLNEDTCIWEAPITVPGYDKLYNWNEEQLNWIEQ
jgi:hypothetical protein